MTHRSQRQRALPIGSRRPRLESLEDRRLLAGVAVGTVDDLVNGDTSSIAALVADDGGDGVSLREAILAANATPGADTITFDPAVFTGGDASLIRLTKGELKITDTLTIDASAATDVLITGDSLGDDVLVPGTKITDALQSRLTGNGTFGSLDDNSRLLSFSQATGDLSLVNLTLTGSWPRAGVEFLSSDRLTLTETNVSGNYNFYNNGGGIHASDGSVVVHDSEIGWNSSYAGGGIYVHDGNLTLNNSTVIDNDGGGLEVYSAQITVNDSLIIDNQAGAGSGAGSFPGSGGGIHSYSGPVTVNDSIIRDNSTDAFGGGIFSDTGTVTLNNSTLINNAWGAVLTESAGVNLFGSALIGNDWSAIRTASGTITIHDSTLSGNTRGIVSYGAFPYIDDIRIEITGSTITNNDDQGIVVQNDNRVWLRLDHTIVAGNGYGSATPDVSLVGPSFQTILHSLIGDTTGSGINASPSNGNLLDVDPLLGPLADNGGPTQTHALLPGSPAIDMGDPSVTFDVSEHDQRGAGYFRVADGGVGGLRRDIGAYEVQTANPLLPGDHNLDGVVDAADYTVLRDALANPDPVFSQADIDVWRANYGVTLPPASAELATTTEQQTIDLAFALLKAEPRQRTAAHSLRTATAITDSAPPVNTDLLLLDQTERLSSSETTDLEETNGDREGRTRRTEADAPSPRSAWGLREGL